MEDFKKLLKLIIKIILPCILVCSFAYLFFKFITIFIPFVTAWFISLLIIPLVKRINKKLKIKHKFFNRTIVVLTIGGLLFLIGYIIYELISFVPDVCDFLYNKLSNFDIDESKIAILNSKNIDFSNIENFISENSGILMNVSQKAIDVLQIMPDIVIKVLVCILAIYYFVVEELDLNKILIKIIPESFFNHYEIIKNNAKNMFTQYFIAQFKISGVIFIILLIGFFILKVENLFTIAFFTTLLDWLPVFGTGAVLWPWALYYLLSGNYTMALGLAIIYVVSQLFRQLIQPKLISDTVGISSIATLFFMYVGFLLAGIGGMLIAVPVGVFVINLIKAGLMDNWISDIKELIQIINKKLYN